MLSSTIAGGIDGGAASNPALAWGVMNGDLSLVELEAFLELDGPITPVLKPESEIASRGRYIRSLGTISLDTSNPNSQVFLENVPLKGLEFSESGEGANPGWDWWVYNTSSAAPLTTGATLSLQCRNFVEWNPSG